MDRKSPKKSLGEKNQKCLKKTSEMPRKTVLSVLENAYFVYLGIIMHVFNFLVVLQCYLDRKTNCKQKRDPKCFRFLAQSLPL